MSSVIDLIRSRGYWDVSFEPSTYEPDRVAYADLDEVLASAAVRLRGWPVPFIERRDEIMRGESWIAQDIDASMVGHYEAWRFFMSGQFNQMRSISIDWHDSLDTKPAPTGPQPQIQVWEILFYLTEVFELAARLFLRHTGPDESVKVDVSLKGVEGRELIVGQRNRAPFMTSHRTQAKTLHQAVTLSRETLVAEGRSQAISMSQYFFARFGWSPPTDQLAAHQQELTSR